MTSKWRDACGQMRCNFALQVAAFEKPRGQGLVRTRRRGRDKVAISHHGAALHAGIVETHRSAVPVRHERRQPTKTVERRTEHGGKRRGILLRGFRRRGVIHLRCKHFLRAWHRMRSLGQPRNRRIVRGRRAGRHAIDRSISRRKATGKAGRNRRHAKHWPMRLWRYRVSACRATEGGSVRAPVVPTSQVPSRCVRRGPPPAVRVPFPRSGNRFRRSAQRRPSASTGDGWRSSRRVGATRRHRHMTDRRTHRSPFGQVLVVTLGVERFIQRGQQLGRKNGVDFFFGRGNVRHQHRLGEHPLGRRGEQAIEVRANRRWPCEGTAQGSGRGKSGRDGRWPRARRTGARGGKFGALPRTGGVAQQGRRRRQAQVR